MFFIYTQPNVIPYALTTRLSHLNCICTYNDITPTCGAHSGHSVFNVAQAAPIPYTTIMWGGEAYMVKMHGEWARLWCC